MKKVGRPSKYGEKCVNINIALPLTTYEELQNYCTQNNLSKTEVINDALKKIKNQKNKDI